MKNILISFITCFFTLFTTAQNLVPNPSFEEYTSCPDDQNQISRAIGWIKIGGSVDYYNKCASNLSNYSTPFNLFGFQYPASGNAYAGFFANAGSSGYRELLGIPLTSNLQIGSKYFVDIKVSLSTYPFSGEYCACNKIGALFSTGQFSFAQHKNYAHVYSNIIITDTADWVSIKGSFVADSAYSFLNIGNFFSNSLTDFVQIKGNECNAYYYLDNICLSTDSNYCNIYNSTESIYDRDFRISIYPNPFKDFININAAFLEEPYNIVIYNGMAQEIFSKENISDPIEHIPIESMGNKLILIKIVSKNKSFVYKLLKTEL